MKEYRVMQLVTEGPNKGKWKTAWHPGGPLAPQFKSLEDAQAWIDRVPEVYAAWYRQLPPQYRKTAPKDFRIEVREVTPWEAIDAAELRQTAIEYSKREELMNLYVR